MIDLILEKYKYLYTDNHKKCRRVIPQQKTKVIPPIVLEDNSLRITTPEEKLLIKSIVPLHDLADYRRKVNVILLPDIKILLDSLIERSDLENVHLSTTSTSVSW